MARQRIRTMNKVIGALCCLMAGVAALAAAGPSLEEAERLADEAVRRVAEQPEASLGQARKALALTADFEPTAFVNPGRKGEVVEDAYVAARGDYRRHRAHLYDAVGQCLARAGREDAAVRYLRRAAVLDPMGASHVRLARSLVAIGRGRPALDALLAQGANGIGVEALEVGQRAADTAGLPSLQVEIDRVRLLALPTTPRVEYRDGPLSLPEKTRLSTGALLRFDAETPILIYVAEPSCASCSADLESLKRLAPPGARVALLAQTPDHDQALRGAVSLYRYDWPFLVGPGIAGALSLSGPSLLVVARRGFCAAVVQPPLAITLPGVLEVFAHADVHESVPRGAWNRRPVDRKPTAPPPGLLEQGLAPGEDELAPPEFRAAVEAYAARRFAEALRLFETLEARGDGWLLPPEARLDRALCLAGLGRREEARRLLLRTGDSRFQDAVDRALEDVSSGATRGR